MEDDYGADEGLLAAMAATNPDQPSRPPLSRPKIQQPIPQRLDRPPAAAGGRGGGSAGASKVVQPTPQALPSKNQSGSSILVSPRQRGNPVLTCFKTMPWEYSDIPADYVMGLTTCGLFLSLKYHRLHPEYIYTRIRNLQGKYNLRVLLIMVDIPNHEDALRELSKTSLVNNVTILLCWSASEAAHYLELYKSYENASFSTIKGQQSTNYADRLVDFVTVPRSLNKSDAVALVANFGSLRNAVNAEAEALSMISGWGGVKVKRWLGAVEEPFRVRKAAKRGIEDAPVGGDSGAAGTPAAEGGRRGGRDKINRAVPLSRVPLREMSSMGGGSERPSASGTPTAGATPDRTTGASSAQKQFTFMDEDLDDEDEEEAMMAAAMEESRRMAQSSATAKAAAAAPSAEPDASASSVKDTGKSLGDGVAAALAKLRKG